MKEKNKEEKTNFGHINPQDLPIFTDLYEITMMQGYYKNDYNPQSTFSLFFRELPENRGYLTAAGLEQAINYIHNLSFEKETLEYLSKIGFKEDFLDYLKDLEFTGDIRAIPEGTPVFPDEPLIEVTAPIIQAQLFETLLINQVGFQTLIATKATRMKDIIKRKGKDQTIIDFGSRRAHGTDAGIKAARASYIGGFEGTSNVAAGKKFNIPVFGTMAHSWIQAFPTEKKAFEAFIDIYKEDSILLVDTYDTIEGTKKAMEIAKEKDIDIRGIRLDSGDLAKLSKKADDIIEDFGIFVSSGIDEYKIDRFFKNGGICSGFGSGTSLVTSDDAPYIDIVYKLTEVEEKGKLKPSMKLSTGKKTYPSRKIVKRKEKDGKYKEDIIGVKGEKLEGKEQLIDIIKDGKIVYNFPDLDKIKEKREKELEKLKEKYRKIRNPEKYSVKISKELKETTENLQEKLLEKHTSQ